MGALMGGPLLCNAESVQHVVFTPENESDEVLTQALMFGPVFV
jgi:hypothetical protein